MKKTSLKIFSAIFLLLLSIEVEDILNPSDSGDMQPLNYMITKYKATNGDINSKLRMLSYYRYNPEGNENEMANLIIELIQYGYGRELKGFDHIIIDLIDACRFHGKIKPKDVAIAFQILKKNNGGNLTVLGAKIENNWRNNTYKGCQFFQLPSPP